MTGRNDIVGYTLAEIAFLLLFATVAILLPKSAKLSAQLNDQIARTRVPYPNQKLNDFVR